MKFATLIERVVDNAMTMRRDILGKLLDPRRDLDIECGYPKVIGIADLRYLYDREGHARRAVQFWPEESWAMNPDISENEDSEDITEFEQAWLDLQKKKNLFHHLAMIDTVSGIGRFGVLLLGINDGLELSEPVKGFNPTTGEFSKTAPKERELLYLRAMAENVVDVQTREGDPKNPRFGQANLYSIKFVEEGETHITDSSVTKNVHWTRVIHVADNRETSQIYGTPRLQWVYNRVYDIRKVAGSSGEMFYKGGFPGYAVETHPTDTNVEIDIETTKAQLEKHFNGIQRYMALTGVTIKSLAPQVADPTNHVDMLMKQIAFAMGVPWRKFIGSEQSQLASSQDDRTWNKRVKKRNEEYVTPLVVNPFIERLIGIGILPAPAEEDGFSVDWPDLNTVTDLEKAEVADKRTQAMAKYVTGGVDVLVPPREYLTMIHHMDPEEVDQILDAQVEHQDEIDERELEAQAAAEALARATAAPDNSTED